MQANEYFTKKVKMPLANWGIGYEVFNIITFDPLAPESQAKISVEALLTNHLQSS